MAMCDYNAGERAMLIKTHQGDWAVLVGVWKGLREGIPGTRSECVHPYLLVFTCFVNQSYYLILFHLM